MENGYAKDAPPKVVVGVEETVPMPEKETETPE